WKKHAHKGRAGWTEKSKKSYRKKMSGPNNPAWKGGVTYRKRGPLMGSDNPSWKGGITYRNRKGNYAQFSIKYVRCPEEYLAMARKDGYIMEHRLLVARYLERCLPRTEVIHHKNHDPTDNRLENLALFKNNTQHKSFEGNGNPQPLWQL
ncbi:unnamed protein product, partial [marine sediment metagenome]